jgi:hypothetical protein
MSTKIYEAWRYTGEVFDIARVLETRLKKAVTASLQKYIEQFQSRLDEKPEFREHFLKAINARPTFKVKDDPNTYKRPISAWDVGHHLYTEYRKQAGKAERSEYDMDVRLAFRKLGRNVYITSYCETMSPTGRGVYDVIQTTPGLREYGYWNNTDKPPKISAREWNRRRKVWDTIWPDGDTGTILRLDIMSTDRWFWLDQSPEMDKKRSESDPTFFALRRAYHGPLVPEYAEALKKLHAQLKKSGAIVAPKKEKR